MKKLSRFALRELRSITPGAQRRRARWRAVVRLFAHAQKPGYTESEAACLAWMRFQRAHLDRESPIHKMATRASPLLQGLQRAR